MKVTKRYQSQLLPRRSYKPSRTLRINPGTKLTFVFRPVRFGVKPKITTYEHQTDRVQVHRDGCAPEGA